MENQHRKIVGYRELTKEDIDLMNRVKKATADMLQLREEVVEHVRKNTPPERAAIAEPMRWLAIAKTDIQTGAMALIRAVAQPTDC